MDWYGNKPIDEFTRKMLLEFRDIRRATFSIGRGLTFFVALFLRMFFLNRLDTQHNK